MITTSKHYIKYIRIIDNTGYESYLEQGEVYGVLEQMAGDIACYYKLDVECPYKEGLWLNIGRCSDVTFPKQTIDLPSMLKQQTQRVISIPDDSGHIVDLQRIQYISPIDKGSYKVTLVSGWEMPLTDSVYSREKLIGLWRMLQNK